jgi:DNA repair protein REV1
MDCFFANVVLRNYPQYRDKPVAISHHGKKRGEREVPVASENSTSECATCNYPARKFGIKKGMYLGRARQLCPDLIVLHYDFAGYEEVSEQVLSILHRVAAEHAGCVEAVSCDEAYMELHLPYRGEDTMTPSNLAGEIAESIRKEIFETTQCTASIGVAANKFLAKIGTDRVKPNGNFVVNDHRLVLEKLRLLDLHGIGYRSEPKLLSEGLDTVQDVWDLGSKAESVLGRVLGPALGKKIYDFCHGHDDRQVKPAERKTIGAECNYGVRFDGPYGIDNFMNGLAAEVEKRMEAVGCRGSKLTLKVKQRKQNAKPPPKVRGNRRR